MKKNKKAFTLVEVLAIIVILAIIALIAIPNITGYVQRSKEESFKTSVNSLIHSYQYKTIDEGDIGRIDICDLDINKCNSMVGYVDVSDDTYDPESGVPTSSICVYLTDGSYCAIGCGPSYDIKPGDCSAGDGPSTPPTIVDISVTDISVSSAKVLVSFTEKGLVTSLKFRLLDSSNSVIYDWRSAESIDNSSDNKVAKISYKNLTQGKTYKVEVQIVNNSPSNNVASSSKTFQTLGFEVPVITYSHVWEKEKNVTITYSSFNGVVNRYSVLTNNGYPIISWRDVDGTSQTLTISNYHYVVAAKSSVGGSSLDNSAQIGYVDNEKDENNSKPNSSITDYKNSNGINTKDIKLTLTDQLSGVGYYCVSTTNNSNNCNGTGNNSEVNKWVLVSSNPEVRNTTKQHTFETGGTYYLFVKDYVGNISDPRTFTTYKVHYDLNGGSANISDQTRLKGTTLVLSDVTPTRSGYEFLGWDTNQASHTAAYNKMGSYTTNSDVTLYAIWRKTITITYNGNGGSGSVQNSTCYRYNAEPTCEITFRENSYSRTGYTFKGWALGQNGAISYNANGKYDIDESKTVYAGWQANTLTFNDQSFSKTFSTLSQTINMSGASNGVGTYTYSEVSEKNASGVSTNYISINNNGVITLSGSIPVGVYTYTVRATEQVSNNIESKTTVTKDAVMTITVKAYDLSTIEEQDPDGSLGLGITIGKVGPNNDDKITYQNSPIEPKPTVTFKPTPSSNSTILVEGVDFEYIYSDNTDAGTATITVKGIGNYSGMKSKTFTIDPYPISSVSIGSITALTYNGAEQKPTPAITASAISKTLTNNTDFTYSYSNNKNAGTGTVTITGKGNFTGTTSKTFTINPKSVSVVWGNTAFTYNNANQKPTASVTTGVTNETMTLSVSGEQKNYRASAYTATASCSSVTTNNRCANYTLTNTTTNFTIAQFDVANATISSIAAVNYSGAQQKPTFSVTAHSPAATLSNTNDYSYSYGANINAGTNAGSVTITGKGNYKGTKTAYFTINKINATSQSVQCATLTYNGANQSLISSVNVSNGTVYYSVGTQLTASNYTNTSVSSTTKPSRKDASAYTVYWYAPATTNYNAASGSVSCTISPKSIAVSWNSTSAFTYNGSSQVRGASINTGVTNETMTLNITGGQTNARAAAYTATAACASVTTNNRCANYSLTNTTATFTIGAATLQIPTSPDPRDYTGSPMNSNITCPSGSTSGGTTSATNANTYTQTCTLSSTTNYKWSDNTTTAKSITWVISRKKNATTGSCQTRTYTGSAQTLASGGSFVSYSTNNSQTNAGTYSITVTADSNHLFSDGAATKTLSCKLSPKILTVPGSPNPRDYTGSSMNSNITCPSGSTASGTQSATNANTYTQTCTLSNTTNYIWDNNTTTAKNITWVISRVKTATTGSCKTNLVYSGSAQTLASGASYASYTNNSGTNATSYTVTVTADSNHLFSDGAATKTLSCSIGKGTLSGSVKVTGTNRVSQTLTASVTNTNSATLTYQWYRGTTAISGATSSTYSIVSADVGKTLKVTVTATKTNYNNATWTDETDATNNGSAVVIIPKSCSDGELVYDPVYGVGSDGFICVKPADSTTVYTCTAGYCSGYDYNYTPTNWRCSVASSDAVEYYGRYYYPRDNGRSATVCVKNSSNCVGGNLGDDYCYDALCNNSNYVCTQSNNTYIYSCTGDKWNGWGLYEKDKTKCFTNATDTTYSPVSVNSSNSTGTLTRKYSCSFNYSSCSGASCGNCSSETIYYHTFAQDRNTRNWGWTDYDGTCRAYYCSSYTGASNMLARCYAQCSGTCKQTTTIEARLSSNQVYSVGGSCVESYGTSPCESIMVYCPYVSSDVRFWDANISMAKFSFESKPSNAATKLSNMYYTRTVDALNDRAFIKYTLGKHQACVGNASYNTVCLDRYYWQGEIGTLSTDAGNATKNALSSLLYSAFHGHDDSGQYSISCTSDASSATCVIVDLNKDTYYSSPTSHGQYYTPLTSTAGCYANYLGDVYCSDGAYYAYVSAQEGKSWIAKWD